MELRIVGLFQVMMDRTFPAIPTKQMIGATIAHMMKFSSSGKVVPFDIFSIPSMTTSSISPGGEGVVTPNTDVRMLVAGVASIVLMFVCVSLI